MLAISWLIIFISTATQDGIESFLVRHSPLLPPGGAVPLWLRQAGGLGGGTGCGSKGLSNFLFPKEWGKGLEGLRAGAEADPGLLLPGPPGHSLPRGEAGSRNFLSSSSLSLPNSPGSWVQM